MICVEAKSLEVHLVFKTQFIDWDLLDPVPFGCVGGLQSGGYGDAGGNPGTGHPEPNLDPAGGRPTLLPEATRAGAQEYTNPAIGFSLSYPCRYDVQSSFYHTVFILAPQGSQGDRERASLSVELVGDQTAEWFAGQAQKDNANSDTEITSSQTSIDGQMAYVLGNLQGRI